MLSRAILTLGVWCFTFAAVTAFVSETHVGPTLFTLGAQHGVHLGDLLAFFAGPAWAWMITRSFWMAPRQSMTRVRER